MYYIEVRGVKYGVDSNGCLLDSDDWNQELFKKLAEADGIAMTDKHLAVAKCLRSLNGQGNNLFQLVKILEQEVENWENFIQLYPKGLNQAFRLSGIKHLL